MKRKLYSIIILTFINLLFIQFSFAQWPGFRGANRDGLANETNLLKEWPPYGPKLAWSSDTVGDGFSSAAIQDKVIYTTGKRDTLEYVTALTLEGKLIWQKVLGKASKNEWPESRSTPTVYKCKIYTHTVAGDLACVDAKTGEINWKLNIKEKFDGVSNYNDFGESLLVEDDKIILSPCGKSTTIVALNRLTGETLWKTESIRDTNSYTSPVLLQDKGKKVIVTAVSKNTLAIDFHTGKIIWIDKTGNGMVPVSYNKQVYFPDYSGGKMYSMNEDFNNCNLLWKDTIKASHTGGAVRIGDRIYLTFQSPGSGLACLDWNTGKTLSVNKEVTPASISVADNMLYCYEERNGRVCLVKLNGDNTELVTSFRVKTGKGPHLAHISIAEGLLFIRHGKVLLAYNIKNKDL